MVEIKAPIKLKNLECKLGVLFKSLVAEISKKELRGTERAPRDRAIILTLFQSGMDVSTLCSLRYGDVAEGSYKEEHLLKLELHRPKRAHRLYEF